MSASAWIALGSLLGVVLLQLVGFTVWITRLDMRVKAVEHVTSQFGAVRDTVVRMEGQLDRLRDDLRELAASLQWMRNPATYGAGDREHAR